MVHYQYKHEVPVEPQVGCSIQLSAALCMDHTSR